MEILYIVGGIFVVLFLFIILLMCVMIAVVFLTWFGKVLGL